MLPELLRHSDRSDVLSKIPESLCRAHRPKNKSITHPQHSAAEEASSSSRNLWTTGFGSGIWNGCDSLESKKMDEICDGIDAAALLQNAGW